MVYYVYMAIIYPYKNDAINEISKVVSEGVHFTFISVEPYLHYTGESHRVSYYVK